MTPLIFASSLDILSCARAKWNQPRYRCDPAAAEVLRLAVAGVAWGQRKRLNIRQSSRQTEGVRAVLQLRSRLESRGPTSSRIVFQ